MNISYSVRVAGSKPVTFYPKLITASVRDDEVLYDAIFDAVYGFNIHPLPKLKVIFGGRTATFKIEHGGVPTPTRALFYADHICKNWGRRSKPIKEA